MCKVKDVSSNVGAVFMFALEICHYAYMFLRALFSPKVVLAARLLAAAVRQAHRLGKSQLVMRCDRIRQKKDSRPLFSPAFRLLWVVFSQMLDTWEDLVHLMKPATVKK